MSAVDQKLKMLHLVRILEEETDADHGLTGPQLIERLAECGVEVERKTLYRDIEALCEFGYDVQKCRALKIEYRLMSRKFEDGELLLMADAVQSSKFLTKRKSEALVKNIAKLGSNHLASSLQKHIHVEGRIKTQNESVFYNVDAIQRAISEKRKVEFLYYKYDEHKKLTPQRDGRVYVETPVQLVYIDDFYYLVVWNEKHGDFATYRVDRMKRITVSEEEAVRNERIATFDVEKYEQRVFGMFKGDPVTVTLLVGASAMNSVIDRFGPSLNSAPAGEGCARVNVTVLEAPTFFGWLAQFGTNVVIEKPESLKDSYVRFLQEIVGAYDER